ncbi:MAG: hypothetical protein RLZZ126_2023 [Pseudomonadota bacterium]|jgi:nitrite reductase/ring-hydroxylating ferredoxin subunit
MDSAVALCQSTDLADGGEAVPFDVSYLGQTCRGFAVRFEGQVHAYLNRCAHIPMEMDYQPNRFFDSTGQWLICATHGATYHPATGECVGGPCSGGLVKVDTLEDRGVVHWLPDHRLKYIEF